ncbi:hypothetical protein Hdeb2414_s0001g00015411 [Helianthus debilis subsp. tardiflorus]
MPKVIPKVARTYTNVCGTKTFKLIVHHQSSRPSSKSSELPSTSIEYSASARLAAPEYLGARLLRLSTVFAKKKALFCA